MAQRRLHRAPGYDLVGEQAPVGPSAEKEEWIWRDALTALVRGFAAPAAR